MGLIDAVGFVAKWKQSLPLGIIAVAAVALCCLLGVSGLAGASQATAASRLSDIQPFVGKWQGTSDGQPGTGTVTREYRAVLGDRFIEEIKPQRVPASGKESQGRDSRTSQLLQFRQRQKDGRVSTISPGRLRQSICAGAIDETRHARVRQRSHSRTFLAVTEPGKLTRSSARTNSKKYSRLRNPARISRSIRRPG